MRKSISIGGDSDTIACIAGGIAGAYYDIDKQLIEEADKFIPDDYKSIITKFNEKHCSIESLKDNTL